jgi:hypothetical protein
MFDIEDYSASSWLEIDTSPPALHSIALDTDSDTGHLGDWRTETAIADLVGRTEPFATVTIGDVTTTADRHGRFELENVHLELGTDDYIIMLTDRAGNTTTSTIEVTRLENSAVHWNEIALEAIKRYRARCPLLGRPRSARARCDQHGGRHRAGGLRGAHGHLCQ